MYDVPPEYRDVYSYCFNVEEAEWVEWMSTTVRGSMLVHRFSRSCCRSARRASPPFLRTRVARIVWASLSPALLRHGPFPKRTQNVLGCSAGNERPGPDGALQRADGSHRGHGAVLVPD
eukprot:8323096-Pyramimonas_sp.AAC.2